MLPGNTPNPWEFLKPLALSLGFSGIGAAPAGPVPRAAMDNYLACVAEGRFGEMAYMARHFEQRFDVRHERIVPQAKAVIAATLPFGAGVENLGIWRYVSAHARGCDYHETMKNKLEAVAGQIEKHFPESRHRIFVDSSPVMERTWAVLAGIGSLGKNGQVIVPPHGARVVLGEIICSSVPIPPPIEPKPSFALCEGCNLCMDSCPTGAITAPAKVDATRCLSYWTIENRDETFIPDIAKKLSLVFGCDICTSVCPHDLPDSRSSLEPAVFHCERDFELEDIVQLDDATLSRIIRGTPLERTGLKAIRRNAKIVSENQKTRVGQCQDRL